MISSDVDVDVEVKMFPYLSNRHVPRLMHADGERMQNKQVE